MSKIISIVLAVLFSFMLFVGMTFLIKPEARKIDGAESADPIVFTYDDEQDNPGHIKRVLPKKEIEIQPKTASTIRERAKPNKPQVVFERLASLDPNGISISPVSFDSSATKNGDAIPRIRINPLYPPDAARDGIEGYVTFSFDISELGRPTNIKIIDAKPRGRFERSARRALRKWKYDPKVKNEKAVMQLDQTVTLVFQLESALL
jgi:periplasmic protein TonB